MQSIKFDGFLSISLDKSAVAKTNKNKIECEMMQTRMGKEKKNEFRVHSGNENYHFKLDYRSVCVY